MGLFDNRLSDHAPEYPLLDVFSWSGHKIAAVEWELQQLVQKASGPLEIVPSDHAVYVFSGKPPKKFGLVWIHDGEIKGFYGLMKEPGVAPGEIKKALDALREAYAKYDYTEHYAATIGGREVVVTPSVYLANEIQGIIDGILR